MQFCYFGLIFYFFFFVAIKKSILNETEKKLKNAQICPKQKYYKVACQIINFLLMVKEFKYLEYDNIKKAKEVLEKNVFAYHPGKNIVTFQSQSVELYIKTNADDFGVKLIDLTPADEDNVNSNHATTSNQTDTTMQIPDDPLILPTGEDDINSNQVTTSNQL
jgi:hypothetical protein